MAAELHVTFGTLKIEHTVTIKEPKPKLHGVITFKTSTYTVKGENMAASMVVGSFATLSVTWYDDQDNVAQGFNTTWVSSDSSTIPVVQAAGNPLIANIQALKEGSATITAFAYADEAQTTQIGADILITASTIPPPAGQATHGVISFTQYPSQIPPPRKK